MKKAGVIANPKRPHSADIFDRFTKKAQALEIELFADEQTAIYLPSAKVIDFEQFAETVDVLFALGGDGTVLFCACLLGKATIPIFGVNLGSLGFLTGVSEKKLEAAIDAFAAGTCRQDIRTVAACTILRAEEATETYRILNDAVISFGRSSHISILGLSVDKEPAGAFICDGMIISTPTGSTGHALSAGGPIIQPYSRVFGVSVICPHTLSNRPLIIPDHCIIEVNVQRAHKKLLFSADGQDVTELDEGDSIRVVRSKNSVTFLHLSDYNYFSLLSQKLHWRGTNF